MKIIKRAIELIQFFGIAIVMVSVLFMFNGLHMGMFLNLFIYPITTLSWNSNAQIITPIILMLMGISLFIEHTVWRRILMGLSIMAWVIFGFILLATIIT